MNLFYVINRAWELGFSGTAKRVFAQINQQIRTAYWRRKVSGGFTGHSFKQVLKNTNKIGNTDFVQPIQKSPYFPSQTTHNLETIFLFGKKVSTKNINWHHDILAKKYPSPWYDSKKLIPFYADLKLPTHTFDDATLGADIRVAWELSRLQHLTTFALKFETTKDEKLKKLILDQVENWIDANPFMRGINWYNAMEAGIRSINIIWIWQLLGCSATSKQEQKIACSLYDHIIFIENNWETSATPNNHYIIDLLGHWYLCQFFGFKTKQQKTETILFEQFEKQTLPDGTSYEGSTGYHRLVTECLMHFHELTNKHEKLLQKMIDFLTTVDNVQVGDFDAGKLVTGITVQPSFGTTHFSGFGLHVHRDKNWQVTLKDDVFVPNRPSGHFHNDHLSVTISWHNIALIIDPGSGTYSGNQNVRNKLRSFASHSGMYPADFEQQKQPDLFTLSRNKKSPAKSEALTSKTTYENLAISRSIKIENYEIKITNEWQQEAEKNIEITCNFIMAPDVEVTQKDNQTFELKTAEQTFVLSSDIPLKIAPWICSKIYSQIKPTCKLEGLFKITQRSGSFDVSIKFK